MVNGEFKNTDSVAAKSTNQQKTIVKISAFITEFLGRSEHHNLYQGNKLCDLDALVWGSISLYWKSKLTVRSFMHKTEVGPDWLVAGRVKVKLEGE